MTSASKLHFIKAVTICISLFFLNICCSAAENIAARQSNNQAEIGHDGYKPYPDFNSDKCYNSPDHDIADLCAQWRAAIAAEKAAVGTYWSGFIGLAGSGFSLLSIILLLATLKVTRDVGIAQSRAYLSVKSVSMSMSDQGILSLHVTVTNSGQSPATKIKVSGQIRFTPLNVRTTEGPIVQVKSLIEDISAAQQDNLLPPVFINIEEGRHIEIQFLETAIIYLATIDLTYKDVFNKRRNIPSDTYFSFGGSWSANEKREMKRTRDGLDILANAVFEDAVRHQSV